jgi:hypothetical protein
LNILHFQPNPHLPVKKLKNFHLHAPKENLNNSKGHFYKTPLNNPKTIKIPNYSHLELAPLPKIHPKSPLDKASLYKPISINLYLPPTQIPNPISPKPLNFPFRKSPPSLNLQNNISHKKQSNHP